MEKIHQRSLTIMLLWVSSLVVTIYMFSYRFIDVHIVPRWFITIFEVNSNISCTRSEKYSSILDVSRSLSLYLQSTTVSNNNKKHIFCHEKESL